MAQAVVLREVLIVAGHPRSGTSLICQLAESGGVDFPADSEADEYNKSGYYEIELAKQLSKDLLAEAMTEDNGRKMNSVVQRLNEVAGRAGLKLVRVPAFFFYRHIATDLKAIFVFRHPANVKASMFKRGLSEFSVSWLKNNNALIAAYENCSQSIIISYESLLARAVHVKEGFNKLGLEVDFSRIEKSHQTQQHSSVYITEDETNLYHHLQELEQKSCRG